MSICLLHNSDVNISNQEYRSYLKLPNGHTQNDAMHCLRDPKYEFVEVNDINPELSYSEFIRPRLLPKNTRNVLLDNFGRREYFIVDWKKIMAQSRHALLIYMNRIYEIRKYEFESVLSNWIRTLSLECGHIMDMRNLSRMIRRCHYIIRYDADTLRRSLLRYIALERREFEPGRWDKYCKNSQTFP